MSCIINLRTDLLNNADVGGTWTYNGYSATVNGPFDRNAGPTAANIDAVLTTDNPNVNTNSLISQIGYYSFTYTGGVFPCTSSTDVVIAVINPAASAGSDGTITYNEGAGTAAQDLRLLKNFVTGDNITGDNLQITLKSGSDNPGILFDPISSTLEVPSLIPGSYVFVFTKSPQLPVNYSLKNCANCLPKKAELEIVIDPVSTVCNCTASIVDNPAQNRYEINQTDCQTNGFTNVWQESNDNITWTTVQTGGGTFDYANRTCNHGYRVVFSKAGCPNVVTNILFYSCV